MSTARLLVDYGIGPVPARAGGALAYNDLNLPGRVPLTDRVGLGRILTLPHILETPIDVRIAERNALTKLEEQTVARLLHGSFGSVLVVAGRRVELESAPGMAALTLLTDHAEFLAGLQRATHSSANGDIAVRRATLLLIDGFEPTGRQAADVLNAVPTWPAGAEQSHPRIDRRPARPTGLPDPIRKRPLAQIRHQRSPRGGRRGRTAAVTASKVCAVKPTSNVPVRPTISFHAYQRMTQLRIPRDLVDRTLDDPELTWPGRDGCIELVGSRVIVTLAPHDNIVVTVKPRTAIPYQHGVHDLHDLPIDPPLRASIDTEAR